MIDKLTHEGANTAEAIARDLGARIEFWKHHSVARFTDGARLAEFSDWLKARRYTMLPVEGAGCVAYAAPRPRG